MITRLYADNFRCFTNFEMNPQGINLLLGENGSGKSTVFEALRRIQAVVTGTQRLSVVFPSDDLTVWQHSSVQTFGIDIAGNGGEYQYRFSIEFTDDRRYQVKVRYEELRFNEEPLLAYDQDAGIVQIFGDDGSEGPKFSYNPVQSVFVALPERPDTRKLNWFRERMQRIILVQITPKLMAHTSPQEATQLNADASNFVSWYRYIGQDQGKVIQITTTLKEVLPGFTFFKFDPAGPQHRVLSACFSQESAAANGPIHPYRFDQLSDGQRALTALYTVLQYAHGQDYTIGIDEPANFLALSEVQPWLAQLEDLCQEGELQAFLISHHPEIINYVASSSGYWFSRKNGLESHVKPLPDHDGQGVSRSELMARRWFDA